MHEATVMGFSDLAPVSPESITKGSFSLANFMGPV